MERKCVSLYKNKKMINSIMLIDDEDLFHLVFEDACNILDITLSLEALNSSDEADAFIQEAIN